MRIFRVREAQHFCSSFAASTGDAEGSILGFQQSQLKGRSSAIVEGTPLFAAYRDCSLRDVERSLFFAASHYRRSLDLMIASSSPWAHVTLYYGSWFASRALLGMFGCTIFNGAVVDVESGSPGQQRLRARGIGDRPGQEPTTYTGAHRRFWDLFYNAVGSLRPLVKPVYAAALSPIGGDRIWQIRQRNDVNYDSFVASTLVSDFAGSFSQQSFPGSLPGVMNTQFEVLEAVLELAFSYAGQLGLRTDALCFLGGPGSLRDHVRELVYGENAPELVRRTRKSAVT